MSSSCSGGSTAQAGAGPEHYEPPELLPSFESDDYHAATRFGGPVQPPGSSELPRRKLQSLIAPPSVPSLLSAKTSALVVGSDAEFVRTTVALLNAMGMRVCSHSNVTDALSALEVDIADNGCITFDQILCEVEREGAEEDGAETLLSELKSTSWPASMVFVTPGWPTPEQLARYKQCGARAVLRKPVNPVELRNLFTHLKRDPHAELFLARCGGEEEKDGELRRRGSKGLAAMVHSHQPSTAASAVRSTPLHITAMGVGMVTYLHVHAGRQHGANPTQKFEEAGAFECETMSGIEEVNPEWIYRFVVIVMINLQLDEELLITAVILLERACRVAELILTESNWQSVLLAAIIVAAKTHYDQSVWLGDFVDRLRMYPLDSAYLHEIEMAFLRALRFCVIVRPSSFFRYAAEIATLHDSYCPYTRSMTCDLTYRMIAKECSAWSAQSQKPPAMLCTPCRPQAQPSSVA